jgi:hypothetical protein
MGRRSAAQEAGTVEGAVPAQADHREGAAGTWPEIRLPDNTGIDERIRGFGADPATKQPLKSVSVDRVDWARSDARSLLEECLKDSKWRKAILVRSERLKFWPGGFKAVGDAVVNCTGSPVGRSVGWSQTVSTTHGLTLSASASVGFEDVLTASFSMSYSVSWTMSKTFTDTTAVTVPSRHMGWLERSPTLQTLEGEIWMLLGDAKAAFWGTATITGQANDGRPEGMLVAKERRLSSDEEKKWCTTRQEHVPVLPAALVPMLDGTTTTPRD